MKTLFVSLILFSSLSFAQQRCDEFFSGGHPVLEEIARLHVQIENMKSSPVRQILVQDYQRKTQAAKKSGVDMSSLSSLIENYRNGKEKQNQDETQRKEAIREREEKFETHFVVRNRFTIPKELYNLRMIDDGKKIFTSNNQKSAIYDAQTGKEERIIPYETVVSNDGTLAVRFTVEKEKYYFGVLDLTTSRETKYRLDVDPPRMNFYLSPDKRWVALHSSPISGDTITLIDLHNPKLKPKQVTVPHFPIDMEFSSDGQRLLIRTKERALFVFDTNSMNLIQKTTLNVGAMKSHLSSDGKQVILGFEKTIGIWDIANNVFKETHHLGQMHSRVRGDRYALVIENSYASTKQVYLMDFLHNFIIFKDVIDFSMANTYDVSADGRSFAIFKNGGEVEIWAPEENP
jgi:WD40 repeat protein